MVRKNIQDAVPKAVMYMLVNFVKDRLQSHLVCFPLLLCAPHVYPPSRRCCLGGVLCQFWRAKWSTQGAGGSARLASAI